LAKKKREEDSEIERVLDETQMKENESILEEEEDEINCFKVNRFNDNTVLVSKSQLID